MTTRDERREALKAVYEQALGCTRCPHLAETRTRVVFGAGNADADLMFVGEAPGANEDREGVPFVGQAGKLLDRLLVEIGLERGDVFIANVLKCRPPGNRDPAPAEIENCREYLLAQVELIEPRVICTLGNFATRLLRDDPIGISRVHGQPEVLVLGPRAVRLYPIYHPAAALYTPSMLDTLREDFARLPALLAEPTPTQPDGADGADARPRAGDVAAVGDAAPVADPAPTADPAPVADPAFTADPAPVGDPAAPSGAGVVAGSPPDADAAQPSPDQLGLF